MRSSGRFCIAILGTSSGRRFWFEAPDCEAVRAFFLAESGISSSSSSSVNCLFMLSKSCKSSSESTTSSVGAILTPRWLYCSMWPHPISPHCVISWIYFDSIILFRFWWFTSSYWPKSFENIGIYIWYLFSVPQSACRYSNIQDIVFSSFLYSIA